MFVIKLKQSQRLLRRCCSPTSARVVFYETAVAVYPKLKALEKTDRSRPKEPFQKHFVENLFINKFQRTILEYPEINSLKEYNSIVQRSEDAKNLLAAYSLSTPVDVIRSRKAVACIKDLELCGFKAPVQEGGFGYLNSEFAHFQEFLSADMSILRSISENENFGVDIINRFGTNAQKEKYLKRLLTGESIACFAHFEPDVYPSLDPVLVSTKAVLQPDGKSYVISGNKILVYNANHADVIILSANVSNSECNIPKLTLFVIDKNIDGVTVNELLETTKGSHVYTVNLNQVIIPSHCILGGINQGDAIVKSIFSTRELNNSIHCIAIMKKLLNIAISHCINTKFFKKFKYESKYYKIKIGQITSRIYLMESMSYLVAGRMDSFDDADVFLESLILKICSSENLQHILNETLQIIDRDFFSVDNDFKTIMDDINFISASEYSNNYLKLVLGAAGCKHLINYLKNVNPFTMLIETLDEFNKHSYSLPKRNHLHPGKNHLRGFVHLMFERESSILQDMVLRLCITCKHLYRKYGQSILNRDGDLATLADLAVDIYSTVALIGRASRAYCLGVRNQEVDKRIVESESLRIHTQFIEKQLTAYNYSLNSDFESLGANILNSSGNKKFHPPLMRRGDKNQNR